ncbi:hypothetical protein EVAR_63474_1 [Eumeta japonica]|uniref:Uncharacterized protein n=1 Tax=Eumeta variegata TaxID=151549 RepID=A0A4C1YC19_EUMVA|nr:hypothetical protein EVAR_63474_1 [Eumeta japonica]
MLNYCTPFTLQPAARPGGTTIDADMVATIPRRDVLWEAQSESDNGSSVLGGVTLHAKGNAFEQSALDPRHITAGGSKSKSPSPIMKRSRKRQTVTIFPQGETRLVTPAGAGIHHIYGAVDCGKGHESLSKIRETEVEQTAGAGRRGSNIPLSFYGAVRAAGRLRSVRVCLYYSPLGASTDGDC